MSKVNTKVNQTNKFAVFDLASVKGTAYFSPLQYLSFCMLYFFIGWDGEKYSIKTCKLR